LAGSVALRGQGTLNFVQTGGGQPVVSLQETLLVGGLTSPELLFNFGFVTQEVVVPGTLLDSFTVTIQNPATSTSAVLATIDAGGPVWAPVSPGNLTLSDSQIQRQAIPPPSLQPVLGRGVAFSVTVPLPAVLIGPTLNVTFDLFDNQNSLTSVGWYDNLQTVSVPEPQIWELLVLGVSMLAILQRRCR
jgi:hypothetical protein